MKENTEGCVKPARGVIVPAEERPGTGDVPREQKGGERMMTAKPGHPAPDFEANGILNGEARQFKLSDYRGKWVVLCFYPGDFTFV